MITTQLLCSDSDDFSIFDMSFECFSYKVMLCGWAVSVACRRQAVKKMQIVLGLGNLLIVVSFECRFLSITACLPSVNMSRLVRLLSYHISVFSYRVSPESSVSKAVKNHLLNLSLQLFKNRHIVSFFVDTSAPARLPALECVAVVLHGMAFNAVV